MGFLKPPSNIIFFGIWIGFVCLTSLCLKILTYLSAPDNIADFVLLCSLVPFCLTPKKHSWFWWSTFQMLKPSLFWDLEFDMFYWLGLHVLFVLKQNKLDLNTVLGGHSSLIFKTWMNVVVSCVLMVLIWYRIVDVLRVWYVSHFLSVWTFKNLVK